MTSSHGFNIYYDKDNQGHDAIGNPVCHYPITFSLDVTHNAFAEDIMDYVYEKEDNSDVMGLNLTTGQEPETTPTGQLTLVYVTKQPVDTCVLVGCDIFDTNDAIEKAFKHSMHISISIEDLLVANNLIPAASGSNPGQRPFNVAPNPTKNATVKWCGLVITYDIPCVLSDAFTHKAVPEVHLNLSIRLDLSGSESFVKAWPLLHFNNLENSQLLINDYFSTYSLLMTIENNLKTFPHLVEMETSHNLRVVNIKIGRYFSACETQELKDNEKNAYCMFMTLVPGGERIIGMTIEGLFYHAARDTNLAIAVKLPTNHIVNLHARQVSEKASGILNWSFHDEEDKRELESSILKDEIITSANLLRLLGPNAPNTRPQTNSSLSFSRPPPPIQTSSTPSVRQTKSIPELIKPNPIVCRRSEELITTQTPLDDILSNEKFNLQWNHVDKENVNEINQYATIREAQESVSPTWFIRVDVWSSTYFDQPIVDTIDFIIYEKVVATLVDKLNITGDKIRTTASLVAVCMSDDEWGQVSEENRALFADMVSNSRFKGDIPAVPTMLRGAIINQLLYDNGIDGLWRTSLLCDSLLGGLKHQLQYKHKYNSFRSVRTILQQEIRCRFTKEVNNHLTDLTGTLDYDSELRDFIEKVLTEKTDLIDKIVKLLQQVSGQIMLGDHKTTESFVKTSLQTTDHYDPRVQLIHSIRAAIQTSDWSSIYRALLVFNFCTSLSVASSMQINATRELNTLSTQLYNATTILQDKCSNFLQGSPQAQVNKMEGELTRCMAILTGLCQQLGHRHDGKDAINISTSGRPSGTPGLTTQSKPISNPPAKPKTINPTGQSGNPSTGNCAYPRGTCGYFLVVEQKLPIHNITHPIMAHSLDPMDKRELSIHIGYLRSLCSDTVANKTKILEIILKYVADYVP